MDNEEFQIEDNIPLPDSLTRGRRRWKFMENLKIGQSFVVQDKDRPSVSRVAKLLNIEVTTRRIPKQEGVSQRVRVWRIA
tara:strand:+ start:869 stop:1108 length:240 start_codon:yes stop_codon:yes gene_type:complete